MTWQDPIVALIVGGAVVSLYRHVRGMLGIAKPQGGAGCHGCDDCSETSPSPSIEMEQRRS